jgi:hypothetical protein
MLYKHEGMNGVKHNSVFYNSLRNEKNEGCKTLMPYQRFPNIISMGGEHTQGGYLFIPNITCEK